jgi:hypothetical protein
LEEATINSCGWRRQQEIILLEEATKNNVVGENNRK